MREKKAAASNVAPARDPTIAAKQLRIIVADDDRDTVLTLMIVLRDEGHEVLGIHNGERVVAALSTFEPDALVLDISMPGLSGWEVARNIRKRYGAQRGPLLIGISGKYKERADKVASQVAGFDHYLVKPYEPSDVLRLLTPLRYPSDRA